MTRAVDDPATLARGAAIMRAELDRLAHIDRIVHESRAAQGLPPRITDPIALNRVAELFRLEDQR